VKREQQQVLRRRAFARRFCHLLKGKHRASREKLSLLFDLRSFQQCSFIAAALPQDPRPIQLTHHKDRINIFQLHCFTKSSRLLRVSLLWMQVGFDILTNCYAALSLWYTSIQSICLILFDFEFQFERRRRALTSRQFCDGCTFREQSKRYLPRR
jgi:hypothetical protein